MCAVQTLRGTSATVVSAPHNVPRLEPSVLPTFTPVGFQRTLASQWPFQRNRTARVSPRLGQRAGVEPAAKKTFTTHHGFWHLLCEATSHGMIPEILHNLR